MRSLLLLLAMATSSQGAVLLSNLASPSAGSGILVGDAAIGSSEFLWSYAVTIPGASYQIDSITLSLEEFLQADGNPSVALHLDAAGEPGTLLQTFSSTDLPLTLVSEEYLFTPDSPINLDPNAMIWIVISQDNPSGNYSWTDTSPAAHPTGPATATAFLTSDDGGLTWTPSPNRPKIEVSGTIIPEPSLGLLLLTGLLLLPFRRR